MLSYIYFVEDFSRTFQRSLISNDSILYFLLELFPFDNFDDNTHYTGLKIKQHEPH